MKPPNINTLALLQDVNQYSDAAAKRKSIMHSKGRAFLKELAADLGMTPDSFTIRSNKGGAAVSGEVTLHHDRIYIQISESCVTRGVSVMYRTCKGRKDFSGGQNNFRACASIANEFNEFITHCTHLMRQA